MTVEWVATAVVLVSVLVLFAVLRSIAMGPEADKASLDRDLRRLWSAVGVFEIAVGVFLVVAGNAVIAVPVLMLGAVFLLKRPASRWMARRLP